MQIKKKIALAAAALLISAPLMAQVVIQAVNHPDNLITNNETSLPSTVKVGKLCSGAFGDMGVTKPGEHNHKVGWVTVKNVFCKNVSGNICDADIYTTTDCDKSGQAIGTAHLNLDSGVITVDTYDARYTYDTSTAGTMTIKGP